MNHFVLLAVLIKSLGTSIVNLDDAKISLKGFKT